MNEVFWSHVIGIAVGWIIGQTGAAIIIRRIESKSCVKGTPGENHTEEDSET